MQWDSGLVARSPSCTIADHQMQQQQQQQLDGSASITITNNNSWQQTQRPHPPPPAQLDVDMCDADVFPERASATSRAPRSPEWHEKPSRSTAAANKQEAILWPQPLANAHLTQRILFFCASFPCAVRHGFEPGIYYTVLFYRFISRSVQQFSTGAAAHIDGYSILCTVFCIQCCAVESVFFTITSYTVRCIVCSDAGSVEQRGRTGSDRSRGAENARTAAPLPQEGRRSLLREVASRSDRFQLFGLTEYTCCWFTHCSQISSKTVRVLYSIFLSSCRIDNLILVEEIYLIRWANRALNIFIWLNVRLKATTTWAEWWLCSDARQNRVETGGGRSLPSAIRSISCPNETVHQTRVEIESPAMFGRVAHKFISIPGSSSDIAVSNLGPAFANIWVPQLFLSFNRLHIWSLTVYSFGKD